MIGPKTADTCLYSLIIRCNLQNASTEYVRAEKQKIGASKVYIYNLDRILATNMYKINRNYTDALQKVRQENNSCRIKRIYAFPLIDSCSNLEFK